jgi:hypothetical protein
MPCFKPAFVIMSLVRLVGLEPTTGKTPVDFKPTAYANFATAAPGVYAAPKEYHVRRNVEHDPRARPVSLSFRSIGTRLVDSICATLEDPKTNG